MNAKRIVIQFGIVMAFGLVIAGCKSATSTPRTVKPTVVSQTVVPTLTAKDEIVQGCVVVSFDPEIVGNDGQITPDEINGRFNLPISITSVERLIEDAKPGETKATAFDGTEVDLYDWARVFLLKFDESIPVDSVVAAFSEFKGQGVDFVDPDVYVISDDEPNDTYHEKQWHLDKINAPLAWDIAKGSGVVIAIDEDGGVDSSHEDLINKRVTDVGDAATNDDHGTEVAGVAVAETDNAQGVAGVAWEADFIPYTASKYLSDHVKKLVALKELIKINKKNNINTRYVVNMSWHEESVDDAGLKIALRDLYNLGVVLVVAAGNDQSQKPPYDAWPAKYDDYVIAVGATNINDRRCTFSNYGDWLDVVAPGEDIWTTESGIRYGAHNGTSFAAPQVSGLAALLLQQDASLTPNQVQRRIEDSARQVGGYAYDNEDRDEQMGYGRIDAFGALLLNDPSPVIIEVTGKTLYISSSGRANHSYWIVLGRSVASGNDRDFFNGFRVNISQQMESVGKGKLDKDGNASVTLPAGKGGDLQVIVCPEESDCAKGAVSTVISVNIPTEAAVAPTAAPLPAPVTVLGDWTDSELAAFEAAIEPFTSETSIKVTFERANRGDVPSQLTAQVEAHEPPDIAVLPYPALLYELARKGALVDIGTFVDVDQLQSDSAKSWLDLGSYQGKLYALLYGAGLKSLVWYNPEAFAARGYAVPTTWDEMIALSNRIVADGGTPWCLGIESGSASGWPATDWIEDIMLRTAGSEVYDQWVNHEIPWTDPAMKKAWELFGQIARNEKYVYGGKNGVLNISYADSPKPLFDNPPGCYLHRQGGFAPSLFGEGRAAMVDYDFFLFPPVDSAYDTSAIGWAIPVVMFNDTQETRAFMKYLAAPEAQEILAHKIAWFFPNRRVSLDAYPDALSRKMAQMIVEAEVFRFDGSDLMPQAVGQEAFWKGTLDYIRGADLEAVLSDIEDAAAKAYR